MGPIRVIKVSILPFARAGLQTARENGPSGLHSSPSPFWRAAPLAPVSRPRAKTDRQVSNPPHLLSGDRRSSPSLARSRRSPDRAKTDRQVSNPPHPLTAERRSSSSLARSRRSPDRARRMTARSPFLPISFLESGGQALHWS